MHVPGSGTHTEKKRGNADPFEDGNGFLGEPDRVEDVVVKDRLEEVVLVVGFERRLAGHHLVHQHAQGPPVDRSSVRQFL